MKSQISTGILYLIALFACISNVSATNMTIQDLINSYDYSYYDGTLNVTSQGDFMIDKDNDGMNETLIINISTDASAAGTYRFIVDIADADIILVNETSKTINSTDKSVNVTFSSELLPKSKFNYSIKIYNNNDNLIFRKSGIESQIYENWNAGTNITRLIDENMNNNSLRINLTVDSTQAITTNVTVIFSYNSSTISKTEEKVLGNGLQTISVNFDNETIKSTHYVGNFTIDSVIIGSKIFDFNQNTSVYNYENFAKTSYIRSIKDGRIDTNANNLSEFLEINFTINVTEAATYNITYDLYDEFDNFVISVNQTQSLSIGSQIMQTLVNGSEIYKTKINGPYVISFVKLAVGNETKDIIFGAHTTNETSYTDYERPPLPDLRINMEVVYNSSTNITNITINLSNRGQTDAFNVFLDIFDNTTYSNNRSLSFLNIGENITYKFNITNSSNTTLFTAIADFDNLVDESNETNNIVQNIETTVSLEIESITAMYTNGTLKIFEFIILNGGDTAVTDIQWQFDTNDSYVVDSTSNLSSLASGEKAFVYLVYNFSNAGNFNVRANATGLSSSAIVSSALTSIIGVGDFAVTSFSNEYTDITKVILEIQAQNYLENNLTKLNWSLNTGNDLIINATNPFTYVRSNETVFIFVDYDYGKSGIFNPILIVSNQSNSASKTMALDIKHIQAYNLSLVNQSVNGSIFEFVIKNNLNYNLTNVNWTFDTKNGDIINSTNVSFLQPGELMFVYIKYNFTSSGAYNVNGTAKNDTLTDSRNLTMII